MDVDAPPPLPPGSPRHRVAVAGVARDPGGRILLVRSPERGWELPGGKVEIGEDMVTALMREIDEETGCRISVDRPLGIYSVCDPPYLLMNIFACTYLGGEIRGSHEAPDVAWFAPEAARRVISPPPEHAPIDDILAPAGPPVFRAHQQGAEVRAHDGLVMAGSGPAGPLPPRLEVQEERHILAVAGAIHNEDGRLLLVRSEWRGWEFPGGQVEQGEDLIGALQREVEEESGCTVDVGRLAGIYCNVGVPYIFQFVFACSYRAGELRPSRETPEVAWLAPADALALPIRPPTRARLEDALNPAPGLAYRVYRVRPAYEPVSARRFPLS